MARKEQLILALLLLLGLFPNDTYEAVVFQQSSYSTNLDEEPDPGVLIVELTVLDTASSGNITFSIEDANFDNDIVVFSNITSIFSNITSDDNFYNVDLLVGPSVTQSTFDYDERPRVVILIGAANNVGQSAEIPVIINLVDVNDNAPVFQSTVISVQEDEPVNSIIGEIEATDKDSGIFGYIAYQQQQPQSDVFMVQSNGDVRLLQSLDYETQREYHITVIASDHGDNVMSSTAEVMIAVIDVNDRNPLFDLSRYSAEVYENHTMDSVILQISARDGDEGINDTIIYSIASTEPSGPFTINSSTGHIILSGSLDRETTPSYYFRVTATEMMAMNSHNSTAIRITVLDVNDNYPVFTDQSYNISINEDISVGRTVLTVTVRDDDVDENARTIYSIINQSVPFMIRPSALGVRFGEIIVDERLDYETQQIYTFEVMAQDSSDVVGSGSFQSTATITINLININDEDPQFINAPYEVMIMEHSDNGSVVVMLNVTDRDIGPGGIVEVTITSNEDVFEIANDFEILVKNSSLLDYETTPQYLINVMAIDMGTPPLSSTSMVVVNVINDNDNVPIIYCQPVEVIEDLDQEFEITTINASDADGDTLEFMIDENRSSPINVEQFFNFSDNRLVASSIPIDYEEYTELVLSITVTDGDPGHVSDCLLNITVIDINDNDPVINEPRHFTVREDTEIGGVIGTINATDKDSEEFGIINYSLNNGTSFAINITTGELYVNRSLDYETQRSYLVVVMVTDYPGGEMRDRLSDVDVINITVEDVNDNAPVFNQSEYTVIINENVEEFNYTRVRATDRDTGDNAKLTFDIQYYDSIDDLLMIDQSTGFISKMGSGNFDRETLGNISLTVIAYDNGDPQLTGTAQVLIILQDVNEDPPVFNQGNYNFSVFENASVGDIVDAVSATDMDEGPVSYKLNSSQDVPFRLDANTGGIFVDGTLDREILSNYTLHVVASDGVFDSVIVAVVNINILDVNDNPPEFTNRLYRRTVPENVMIGSSIINITATDDDIAPNNIICYSILAEDMLSTPNEITIDNHTGEVSVIAELDFDQEDFESTIVTYVYATDSPDCENDGSYFMDFVTFLLTVTDVNDNCPQFVGTDNSTNDSFMAAVSEGSGMTDRFNTNITVTDADEGEFGRVTVTTNSTDFAVRLSGQDLLIIEILTELDREIMDNHVIFVNATDGGGCSMYINLIINLVDVNEHPPVFNSSDGYVTNISEGNYSQPHVVFTGILAEDMETDGRAIIWYRLQEPHLPFSINAASGVVTVNGVIDRETNSSFNLTVIANEEGDQSSNTTLTIIVDDVNDNVPVISSCSNDSIPETDITGTPLLTVIASDDDEGELFYFIEDLNDIFSINSATGVITNNQILDYEGVRMFNFTVTVSDTMNNISEHCRIALSDVNDNAPQFTAGCCNNVTISENAAVGTLLDVVINATDADTGNNGEVKLSSQFSFIDKFQLLENGSINVTGMLDYETQSEYTLLIIASDMASSPLTSRITIVVELKNENDNDPSFDNSIYEFVINEHSPNGTVVGSVTVTDADGDPVSLSVVNGPFLVDSNGMVTSNEDINFFDYDDPPINYHFTISATDEDDSERTDTAYVVVLILDVNDNPPAFIQYYNTTLASGTYNSQPLLALVALDGDSSNNGLISYNIQSDSSGGMFQVDNVTGLLTVNGSFDMNMMYTLTVSAMDHGDPSRSDTTIVTVNVVELIGSDSSFHNAPYNVNIFENVSNADEILMVTFNAGMAQEYFLATNISQFMINTSSGGLTLTSSLDYEKDAQLYVFAVGAISTTSSSTAITMVTINLLDVNDNAPVFIDSGDVQAYVEEDSPVNTTVFTLSTVDADSSINSNTGYVILTSNDSSLFSITRQGQLLLSESLDHEASVTQYQLTVMAYDIDVPSLNNTINITINVLDSNDHDPVFTQLIYTASINEAATNSSRVLTIIATDQDNDVNGDIFFTIIDGDTGHFVIANTKSCEGTIYTTGNPTDRELTPVINLTVQASDRGSTPRTSHATVIITLLDINDNAPVLNTVGPFNVMEDISTGVILTLSADDEDLLDNGYGVVNYFLDGNFNGLFSINDATGELIISSTLDRETEDVYNLTVILWDTPNDGSQVNSDSFNVIINVLDVNDNDPQFIPVTMPLRINENDTLGSVVVTLTATDNDEGSNANIIISIASVTPRNHTFRIKQVNLIGLANLIVNSELDRELIPLYIIVVKATDMGNPVRSSTMTLNVLVTDVNDNPPFFIMSQFSFTVREDAPIGTNVSTLSAIDLDDTSLRYGYKSDVLQFFNIDQTNGVISVGDSLDREINSSYNFVARVSDGIREDTAEVVITVMDVNDNRPQFTNQVYIGSIEEGSLPTSPVMMNPAIAAIDNDQMNTPNSRVIYSLVNNDQGEDPSDYFDINPITALVVVSLEGHNRLDYENATYYNLTVQAVDAGNPPLTGIAILTINIIDLNDNAPMFMRLEFTVEVIEEQPFNGMLFLPLTVSATDPDDEAVNGAISYSISDGSTDVFALNNETGQLSAISRIDAEEENFYNLTVVARDGNTPFHSASASIIIIVHDINDNAPQFNASIFLASVEETADGEPKVEQYATTLGITDVDRGTNNSNLTVNVLSDKFVINPETHRLFTNSSSILDREISSTEEFLVIACDQGVEQQCSNVTVVVTLLDVNDNDPQFDQPNYTLTIRRLQPMGSTVGVFIAQDEDIGNNGELRYSLQSNVTEEIFRIDNITGSLILNQHISQEFINSSIELIITASDQGVLSRSGSVTVIVMILGELSVVPVFNQSVYNVSIIEGREPGTRVVTVSASSTIPNIEYFIESQLTDFAIDTNQGVISTAIRLSRDNAVSYSFSVRAFNGVASGFSLVVVTVNDSNDHSPQFENLPYVFDVVENNERNEFIGQIVATDQDSGSNAELQYTIIQGNENNLFYISPFNGSLFAGQSFDREEMSSDITITVMVTDMGMTPLNATTTVTITILDENDNSPMIQNIIVFSGVRMLLPENNSVIVIPENHPPYTPFIQFDVFDPDEGRNGDFVYSFQSNSDNFVIDRHLGSLQNVKELDYDESRRSFSLTIVIMDRGQQPRSIERNVTVNVSDVNDCTPDFDLTSETFILINEELPHGTSIANFTAADCDSGNNSLIQYSITRGNEDRDFSISNSGHLTTNIILDREKVSEYILVITAADLGVPSLNSSIELTIELNDIDDNAPQFEFLSQTVTVSENIPLSSIIATVNAIDPDPTSVIRYMIASTVFAISSMGRVTLIESLDREILDQYNVTITATDDTNSNYSQLVVDVLDVNDNSPEFLVNGTAVTDTCQVMVSVPEHVNNSMVYQLTAIDADEGENSEIVYSFLISQDSNSFALDSNTGEIRTRGSLDHEIQSIYTLPVTAEDQAILQRRETGCTVIVQVDDINDNPPQFLQDVYFGSVSENVNGFNILTVSATDEDATLVNNLIQYEISDSLGIFSIHPDSGVIRNLVPLDRENVSVYNITVIGINTAGMPSLNDTATVIITVLDENEFAPTFVSPPDSVNVSEIDMASNELILQLIATDMDDNPDVVFTYSLLTRISNSPFRLESADGLLFLTGTLDFEQGSQYNLTFEVSDGERSSNTSIIVKVIDENDNAPYFDNVDADGYIHASVLEGESDVVITRLIVNDDDTDEINTDSMIQLVSVFSVTNSTEALDQFELDPLTGDIKVAVNMSLDREENEFFILNLTVNNTRPGVNCVINSDSCNLISAAELLVTVNDINDNPPVFTSSVYNGDITTTVGIGQRIVQVEATDKDELFGPIIYELNIETGKALNFFGIDKTSGEVVTQASFLDSVGENFTFTVVAKDNGGIPFYQSAEATVTVIVLDNLQRVVITFQCHQSLIVPQANKIMSALENITGYFINLEAIEPHYERDRTTGERLTSNANLTDFVFYGVDRTTNKIVEGEDVIRVLVNSINLLEDVLDDGCEVQSAQAVQELLMAARQELASVQVVLIILAGVIGSGGLLMLCLAYRQRFVGRKLRKDRYNADVFFGPGDALEDIKQHKITTRTENYEMVGEPITYNQPIIVQPYQDWANVEKRSDTTKQALRNDNPLYESQEIRMEMFADMSETDFSEDEAGLLAAAIADENDEEDVDELVTAI